MSLKLYYDLMSQPSRALYLFLKVTKIPFTECPVALRKGEHFTEDYEKINPFKKVPAIDHDGFRLAESVGIFRYLMRNFSIADHWYPKDNKMQAKIDEYLEWQHLNVRLHGSMVFQTKFLIPLMTKQPVNEKALQRFEKGLNESLSSVETIFLARGPFLCGSQQISVADILCACELEQPRVIGYDIFTDRPRLAEWMAQVKSMLNPDYEEAHRFIYKIQNAQVGMGKL